MVAAPDYLAFLLSGALLVRLREDAPGIRIRFVDVPMELPDSLNDATIDLAVCGDFGFWPDLRYEQLFRDRMVAAVSNDHPLQQRKEVNSADLLDYPGLNYDTGVRSSRREVKAPTGIPSLDWAPQISTGQFADSVLLAVGSSVVARAPSSLVERLKDVLCLTALELSGEETMFDTGMFWAPLQDHAQEHAWLRGVIRKGLMQAA